MLNILARTKRRIKKLCEYHTRKADKYEALAAYYTEKSRQHRTASKAYIDAATTLEIETLDVSDCDVTMTFDRSGLTINNVQMPPVYRPRTTSEISQNLDRRIAEGIRNLEKRNVLS